MLSIVVKKNIFTLFASVSQGIFTSNVQRLAIVCCHYLAKNSLPWYSRIVTLTLVDPLTYYVEQATFRCRERRHGNGKPDRPRHTQLPVCQCTSFHPQSDQTCILFEFYRGILVVNVFRIQSWGFPANGDSMCLVPRFV